MRQRRVRVLQQRDGHEPCVDDQQGREVEEEEAGEAERLGQREQPGSNET